MHRHVLLTILISVATSVFAQNYTSEPSVQSTRILSPEPTAFEKYGNVPVGLYTGTPDVSIPIYTVSNGDAQLPITLNYLGTAIKVNQEASWVGLNWLLNAGGVISTKVSVHNGIDMQEALTKVSSNYNLTHIRQPSTTWPELKFNGSHEMGWTGDKGKNLYRGILHPDTSELTLEQYTNILQNKSGEAVKYSANFLGRSFDFVYDPMQRKYIIDGQDNRYIIKSNAYSFTLISAEGTTYTFGKSDFNVSSLHNNDSYVTEARTFYLTKIESVNGNTIELSYGDDANTKVLPEIIETYTYGHPSIANFHVEKNMNPHYETTNHYLRKIKAGNVEVVFQNSGRMDIKDGKKLDAIEVYVNGEKAKRIEFRYDYFLGNGIGGDRVKEYYSSHNQPTTLTDMEVNTRLKLVAITEKGYDGNGNVDTKPPYEFTYIGSLPSKTSSARDFWGYYNGIDNQYSLSVGHNLYNESP